MNSSGRFERSAWFTLLGCIALMPLAVTKLSFMRQPLTIHPFGYPQNVVFFVGIGAALVLWAVALLRSETRLMLSRALLPFAAFGVWSGVATVAGYEPMRSLLGASTASLSLAHIAGYLALGWLTLQLVTSPARVRTLTWTVLASSSVVAVLALVQQLFGSDLFGLQGIESWRLTRGFSTLGNPDYVGIFLITGAFLAWFLLLSEPKREGKIVAGVALFLTVAACVGTLTRGAWVALAAGLALAVVLLLPRRAESRRGLLTALGIFVIAAAMSLALTSYPLQARFHPASGSTTSSSTSPATSAVDALSSGRISLWRSAARIAAGRPLTGTGPAAFELGWYANAVNPSSYQGSSEVPTDPHSLPVYVLATTGVPGLLAVLGLIVVTLLTGARFASSLLSDRSKPLSAVASNYLGWLVAAVALQIALLVGVVTTPVAALAFVGFGVLLRPSLKPAAVPAAAPAAALALLGVALIASVAPSLAAESALARATSTGNLESARSSVVAASWNMDVQRTYFGLRRTEAERLLKTNATGASGVIDAIAADLSSAAVRQPKELYYPADRADLLTRASEITRSGAYATEAIESADAVLAVMPASISIRVDKALALSDLGKYADMAATLEGYWEAEQTSAYPGILYAQALALSGNPQKAWQVFDELSRRFPNDTSIAQARTQTEQLTGQQK